MREVVRWMRYSWTSPGVISCINLGTEERQQMHRNAKANAFDVLRTAFTIGNDLILMEKLFRRLLECLAGVQFPGTAHPFQPKIPVMSKLLREGETFLLGAFPAEATADKS